MKSTKRKVRSLPSGWWHQEDEDEKQPGIVGDTHTLLTRTFSVCHLYL